MHGFHKICRKCSLGGCVLSTHLIESCVLPFQTLKLFQGTKHQESMKGFCYSSFIFNMFWLTVFQEDLYYWWTSWISLTYHVTVPGKWNIYTICWWQFIIGSAFTFSFLQPNSQRWICLHLQVTDALARAGLESSNLIVGIDFTKSNEWTGWTLSGFIL